MSKDYSPSVVASSFIKQYYEMMTKSPENLHKFYNTDSYFMHSDLTHQSGVSATGPDAIRSAMGALNLKYTKVDLTNGYIDAQKSANNGVFVLVVGTLAPPDAADKPFVQTFLLSNQGSSAYYVSNSVFRLLVPAEEQDGAPAQAQAPAPSAPAAEATPTFTAEAAQDQSAALAAAAAASTAEAAAERASELEAVEALLQEAASEPEASSPAVEAAVPVPAPALAPVAAAAPAPPAAPIEPNRKLNYSDIVRKANTGAAPAAAAPTPVHAPTPAAAPAPAAKPAPAAVSTGYSVYVKQLAEATTDAEIRALFAQFGNILSVEQAASRAFAFVKFETQAAMQAAVAGAAGGKLSLNGQALRVEERNSTRPAGAASSSSGATSGGAGSSGGARGRGDRGSGGGRDRERERGGEKSGGDRERGDRGGNRSSGGDGKGRSAAGNGSRGASGSKAGTAGKSAN